MTDNGLEFAHNLARGAELFGIMIHTTNRMAKRHVGAVKDLLEKEIMVRQMSSMDSPDNLISHLQSSKNARHIRGGFCPFQLVIGNTPNLPGERLADPSCCMASDQEILTPPADMDMMGK